MKSAGNIIELFEQILVLVVVVILIASSRITEYEISTWRSSWIRLLVALIKCIKVIFYKLVLGVVYKQVFVMLLRSHNIAMILFPLRDLYCIYKEDCRLNRWGRYNSDKHDLSFLSFEGTRNTGKKRIVIVS